MVQLPDIDFRFNELGESETLINYAREMGDLLRHRWVQHELKVHQDFRHRDLPDDECQMEMQAEQYQHEQFEKLLGAQVLLAAWAMLEGAVNHCVAFITEQRSISIRISDPDKWPAEHRPNRDVASEKKLGNFLHSRTGYSFSAQPGHQSNHKNAPYEKLIRARAAF